MHKRIMSVNINDLGGKTRHLMNHRYFNNRDRRSHIDWEYWATHIDKTKVWEGLKRYIVMNGSILSPNWKRWDTTLLKRVFRKEATIPLQ